MLKIIVAVIAMVILALADGPVLQTGQIPSYQWGDDGYYRAGVTRSYSRNVDVVIDNATGLEWQDNSAAESTKVHLMAAVDYCKNTLTLGGHNDWRLPTIKELNTLIDSNQYNPSVTKGVFKHISLFDVYIPFSSMYHSSTVAGHSSGGAWSIYFDNGITLYGDMWEDSYVRCVRGGQLKPSSLSRNNATDIVTDSATGLQWQDDSAAEITKVSWADAIGYCENTLTLGGHNDWRLPNRNELFSIVDYPNWPAIDTSVFLYNYLGCYWSSTTMAKYIDKAWTVDFRIGGLWGKIKYDNENYVRCVRGGQVNIGTRINPSIVTYLLN